MGLHSFSIFGIDDDATLPLTRSFFLSIRNRHPQSILKQSERNEDQKGTRNGTKRLRKRGSEENKQRKNRNKTLIGMTQNEERN